MTENIQDFFLTCNDCVLENPRSFYGNFAIGPFKNSQSLTVANALRRTLLAEITNIAISHVEIDGVGHEYCTVDGVRESILDILLNFKQIVLKNSSPLSKQYYGYLNVRGPGIIRASDLKLPPMIQCVDPDQYIATLNENGQLSIKLTIIDFQNSLKTKNFVKNFSQNFESGSFSPEITQIEKMLSTKRQKKITPLQLQRQRNKQAIENLKKTTKPLWVDPILNPILKVNYLIEPIEPIQFDIPNQVVRIELWTNGSIHPRKAFYEALMYLKNMFSKLEYMRVGHMNNIKTVLDSEKTTSQILKTFENDFQLYSISELKTMQSQISGKIVFQKYRENLQKDYLFDLNNQIFHNPSSVPLETLNLPLRILNCLKKHNFLNTNDLLQYTPTQLKEFSGLSDFSIKILQQKLKKFGFFLKMK